MAFRQGHALSIGVGSHRYLPHLDIPVSAADAQAVGEVLSAADFCGYPQGQVSVLHDTSATRQGILSRLSALAEQVTPEDTVFLFFSGHGDYGSDGGYHLITHDTRLAGAKVLAGSGLSQADLVGAVRAIPAGQVLLIFNACHAGEIAPTLTAGEAFGGKALPDGISDALLATGRGRAVINACREEQLSYIGSGSLSIFTAALVAGLRGEGVPSRGGFIDVFDLYTAIFTSVREKVKAQLGGEQEPVLTVLKNVGPFPVGLYQGSKETDQGAAGQGQLPEGGVVRQVSLDQSTRLYQQIMQIGGVNLVGSSGLSVGRDIIGEQRIDTGGGAFIGGNLNTGGGGFVGRDQTIHTQFDPGGRSPDAFLASIGEMRRAFAGIAVDEKVARLFWEELDRLEAEWRHPDPALTVIEIRLDTLIAMADRAIGQGEAAAEIAGLARDALRLARLRLG